MVVICCSCNAVLIGLGTLGPGSVAVEETPGRLLALAGATFMVVGLAKDYPMMAPGYAARRSELAKQIGLGRKPAAAPPPNRRACPDARVPAW